MKVFRSFLILLLSTNRVETISELPPPPPPSPPSPPSPPPPPPPPPPEVSVAAEVVAEEPVVAETTPVSEQVYNIEGDAALLASEER